MSRPTLATVIEPEWPCSHCGTAGDDCLDRMNASPAGARCCGVCMMGGHEPHQAAGTLRAGLAWLFHTVQPDTAIMSHHGVMSPVVGDRRYDFTPRGAHGRPVVVMNVAHPQWDRSGRDNVLTNGLLRGELDALELALRHLGYESYDTWNGAEGCETGSVGLAQLAHPSQLAVVANYNRGCPEHGGSVFCRPAGNGCDWSTAERKLAVQPSWPVPPLAKVRAYRGRVVHRIKANDTYRDARVPALCGKPDAGYRYGDWRTDLRWYEDCKPCVAEEKRLTDV